MRSSHCLNARGRVRAGRRSDACRAGNAGRTGRARRRRRAAAAPPTSAARDLTGVWMMRNPPGKNGPWTNFTYTDPMKSPPALTAWGEAQFKKARDSNGGNYTLDETNDPVLTKCYPPGVPRVYFHPYPFEVIQTPKQTLLIYEYDHWMRRVHTDGRAAADRSGSALDGHVGRPVGGRSHLRGGNSRLQRKDVARSPRPRAQRAS